MGFDAVVKFLHFHNIIRTCFQHTVLAEKTRLYGRNVRCASNWAARALGAERGSLDFRSFSSCKLPLVLVSILLWAAAQNRHALLFPLGQNFHPKVTSGPRKNMFIRPWLRNTSMDSGKILFDCQLWGSVGILPLDKNGFLLDVVYQNDLNFHLKE